MINVIQNRSFPGYYEICEDGSVIEEVQGRNKAKRYALRLARKLKESFFVFLGKRIDVG